MNAYAAAKEMALHYARKHLAIIKNSEFSREDKVKLIKIWLRLYNIPQRLKNDITNPCPDCHRQMRADGGCTFCEKSESTFQESTKKEEATPDEEAKAAKHARKIAQIKKGYFKSCSKEEALEALETDFIATDSYGDKLIFSKTQLFSHYIKGERRRGNAPKPENLEDLPKAVYTVGKSARFLKFPPGSNRNILNPPPYTQRIYHLKVKGGYFYVFAYHNTGLVTGWHYRKNPIKLENSMGEVNK